jgi:hypothetical protein
VRSIAIAIFAAWAGAASAGGVSAPSPPAALDLSGYARKVDVPVPASSVPPGVAVDGAMGTDVTQYALANHTHATSVQRVRLSVAQSGATIRWTFAKSYDPGTIPIVTCTAQNSLGATQPYVVNLIGSATNTYVDVAAWRAQTQTLGGTLVAIAGVTINLFASAPAGIVVNCQAAKPTQ